MDSARRQRIVIDILIILVSICLAGILIRSDFAANLLIGSDRFYPFSAFVSGLFFTSVFTTAPAMVALGALGSAYPPLVVALVGAFGSLIGDFIIFSFIKGHISEDISYLLSRTKSRRWKNVFHHRFMRWSLAIVGALVIASPLPDELGLTLMGLSNLSTSKFIAISYTFNFIGIIAISAIARAL